MNSHQAHLVAVTPLLVTDAPVIVNGQMVIDTLTTTQDRYQMLGFTANRAFGSWLARFEAAYKHGLVVQPELADIVNPWPEMNLWQNMVGIEYSGFNNWTISTEMNAQFSQSDQSSANETEFEMGLGARISWMGLNDRLTIQTLAVALPDDTLQANHGIVRPSVSWDISDGWNTELSSTFYIAENSSQSLYNFRHHDSVNISLKASF